MFEEERGYDGYDGYEARAGYDNFPQADSQQIRYPDFPDVAPAVNQAAPAPIVPVDVVPPAAPVIQQAVPAPFAPAAAPVVPVAPGVPVAPAAPVVASVPIAADPLKPTSPKLAHRVEEAGHAMMIQDEVNVAVKKAKSPLPPPPPLKAGLTENREYRKDMVWPPLAELKVPDEIKTKYADFYRTGMNRQRQKEHGAEVPEVRYPDLIITGAKKCGTTALKIFMNYHNGLKDTPGERHFFNRPANWKNGYDWYHDQMPLTYKDEICYEKTPDYFDRPFVPERMSKLPNADKIKFIHVLCDPVRRSFSHFLHMFTVQATGQGGTGESQPGFEFLQGNYGNISKEDAFAKVVELAYANLIGPGKNPDEVTDEEIRVAANDYYTRWDLKPGDPRRVYPLRIPDAVLTGSLYSIHIRTYLRYFSQDQMLYLDATELLENPGKSMRRVADFVGLPALINENNFYFDEEKGYFCMRPPPETGREAFCLGSSKGRSKNSSIDDAVKKRLRRYYKPFIEDLSLKFTGDEYGHWDW